MKIEIKQDKYLDESSYNSYNYDLVAEINTDDSANAIETIGAVCKAMQIEGYHIESIANAMYNYADYLASGYRFELRSDE